MFVNAVRAIREKLNPVHQIHYRNLKELKKFR